MRARITNDQLGLRAAIAPIFETVILSNDIILPPLAFDHDHM